MRRESSTKQPGFKPVQILNPMFILGFVTLFVNFYTYNTQNFPMGELVLTIVILTSIVIQRKVIMLRDISILFLLVCMLLIWLMVLQYLNTTNIGYTFRLFFNRAVLYTAIIGYLALSDKSAAYSLFLGFFAAHIIYYCNEVIVLTSAGDEEILFLMKYVIPLPALTLLIIIWMRNTISKPYFYYILAFFVLIIVTVIISGSRGAMTSLALGIAFYYATNLLKLPKWLVIIIALYIPLIPVTAFWLTLYEPDDQMRMVDWLFDEGKEPTLSNIEHILMTHSSITAIRTSPFTGISMGEFIENFEPLLMQLTGTDKAQGQNPHNYYMEYAVGFGLPALALVILIHAILYSKVYDSVKLLGRPRGLASFIIIVSSTIMVYQPLSGVKRLDFIFLLFCGFYGLQKRYIDAYEQKRQEFLEKRSPAAMKSSKNVPRGTLR
jgi:hypothetical protein